MKPYEIFRSIKPYILGLISSAGGGTGPYAPTPHDLSSAHHTGSLVTSQYPDALLTDGSRSLLGNLTVGSGITIDGVDISAHVANANAHHAQQHTLVGSDHTASGLTVGHVLRASGASTFAWAQLLHTDLGSVSANQHHNQVHGIVSSDHTVSGAALDVIGLSAANTLAVLTPSADVGTTPAAAILRSTAAGGLILAALTVKGSVDITNGGDLTVGANVLLVDVSGNNVGIAGAPDPQFALDVNGPFHADVIYGPLGRLLKDCIFLAHYDGPPGMADYSGSPQSVQGQIPTTLSGGVVYRPGVYGKALQTAEAVTNKMTNTVFGHATWNTGWFTGADLISTIYTDPNYILYGATSARVWRVSAGTANKFYQSINAGNTNTHCLSAYVKEANGAAITASDLQLYYNGAALTTTYTALNNGWYLLHAVVTGVASATSAGLAILSLTTRYLIGGVQFEERGYPTPLAHGGMGPGHSWAATAHESTSSRVATNVIYTNVPMPENWSVGFWFQPWNTAVELTAAAWLLGWVADADNYFGIIYNATTDVLYARFRGNSVNSDIVHTDLPRGVAYHVAATFDGTTFTFLINGAVIGTATPSAMVSVPTTLGVGSYTTGINIVNGLTDDLYIVEAVQTQDDIGAIIDSEVPVAAERGVISWYSGGIAPIWVDSDGMWMRDMAGDPVFGWSAVNGKSWGGVTLDMGDNLIGRYGASLGGWQQWDRSAGELALGYSDVKAIRFFAGNAEITGKLQMPGTASAIAIGATPPTGAAAGTGIWIDRTGLYGLLSGTYQAKIDATTGEIVAGGGDIKIGSSGFRIYPEGTPRNSTKLRWLTDAGVGASYITGLVDTGGGISNLIEDATALSSGGYATLILRANNYGAAASMELDIYSSGSAQYASFVGGGLYVGRNADPGAGSFGFTGALKSYKNTTEYTGYIFVPLAAPLTSTVWDGDAKSTTAKTLIDLSVVFGAPAGVKAVALKVHTRDSGSAANETYMVLGPTNAANVGVETGCAGLANDKWNRDVVIVSCDANGDIYYQITASAASTFDVIIEIWGYWI